jgi:hypothetical protein
VIDKPVWSREEFTWGKSFSLDDPQINNIDWYVPTEKELEVVKMLFEKYFRSQLIMLDQWVKGEKGKAHFILLNTGCIALECIKSICSDVCKL